MASLMKVAFPCFHQRRGNTTRTTPVSEVYNLGKAVVGTSKESAVLAVPLGIANLVLGPGGIGLGAYSVLHIHQLAHTDGTRTTTLVERNCRDTKRLLMKALDSIRIGSSGHGSQSIEGVEVQESALAEEEIKELENMAAKLLHQHRSCFRELSGGTMPHWVQCEELRTLAAHAVSMLTIALRKMPPGDHKRLPLVMLQLFAVRASIDSRDMALHHSNHGKRELRASFRGKVLREAMTRLAGEAQNLITFSSHTLYTMAVKCAPALAHYILLLKAMALACQGRYEQPPIACNSDGQPVFGGGTVNIAWEDGMDELRALAMGVEEMSEGSTEDAVEIITAADMQWFLEWRQLKAETFLGNIPRKVPVHILLSYLGFPSGLCVGAGMRKDCMKKLVLQDFRSNAEEKLGKVLEVFGLKVKFHLPEVSDEAGIEREQGLATTEQGLTYCENLEAHRDYEGRGSVPATADDTVFSGDFDGTIIQWRGVRPRVPSSLDRHAELIVGLTFSANRCVYSGHEDGSVKRWDDGKCVATMHASSSVQALVSVGEKTVYAGLANGDIEWWYDDELVCVLKGHLQHIQVLAVAKDGSLFSCSGDGTVKRWRDGRCVSTMRETFDFCALAVGADGTLFTGGEGECILRRWQKGKRMPSIQCIPIVDEVRYRILELAFMPEGSLFAGDDDGVIREWREGRSVACFRGGFNDISSFAFGGDGTVFVGMHATTRRWRIFREQE